MARIALLYDDDAYVETLRPPPEPAAGRPLGLMGRQVAGRTFLDAYFAHGDWSELVALVRNPASAATLNRTFEANPALRGRRIHLIDERRFLDDYAPDAPASPLHLPAPLDARYAWARQRAGGFGFAMTGVTHTLCSAPTVAALAELVTAPFEPFDALVCTSKAVVAMVRAVTGTYADYLRDRFGGEPGVRPHLELIPLGVDTERFRPATPEERADRRRRLGIGEDEVAVLFVGRLSHHAKAHPFPMFRGLGQAAARTGRAVHLLLAGWAPHPAVRAAFAEGARAFAPGVRISFLDGVDPETRAGVWQAADLFTSLSDNIQETFGLVVIEAMASGLPVVASDWDGYRDLVQDGETGLLVPTLMLSRANAGLTARLALGEIDYDHFLAESSQAVTVDPEAAADPYARLIDDSALRARFGAAGRRAAESRFAWPRVIRAYEDLWSRQETERQAVLAAVGQRAPTPSRPAIYPDLEVSFAGYPTRWLAGSEAVEAAPSASDALIRLLVMPLTHHVAGRRITDVRTLREMLSEAAAPAPIERLEQVLRRAGASGPVARATLAWMLKYGLLTMAKGARGGPEAG